MARVQPRHRGADALGQRGGLLERRPREDHRELLAAVAGEVVGLARAVAQHSGDRAQHVVALLVADGVVDRLEVVEVHHQQAEVLAVPPGTADLRLERLVEVLVVVDAGEAVADGLPLHLLVGARVLDGDGGQVGEQRDRLDVLLGERAAAQTVQAEHAGHLAEHAQRHDDGGLRHVLAGARDVHAARVASHVVDQLRLVVADDPAGEALVDGDAELLVELRVLVARVDAHQLARLVVQQPDVHGVVVDDDLEHLGDAHEHLALVERAEQQRAEAHELVLDAQLALEPRRRGLELVVLARVADGERRQVGEQARGLELALLEGAAAEPVHGHDADDLVPDRERHQDAGLHLVRLRAGDVDRARVRGHVVDELRLVVAHDPAADADVHGDGEVDDLLAVDLVAGVEGDELLVGLVHQTHVHGVVVDDLLERVGDVLEHLCLLE